MDNKNFKFIRICSYFVFTIGTMILSFSCSQQPTEEQLDNWKEEVRMTEKAFNDMAQEKGLVEAFEYYAAEDGVLRRNKKIVKGKAAIRTWYEADMRPGDTLTWVPSFIDVSQSGDMAYTYGDYFFSYPDTLGNKKTSTGIFHTVWKRQADGEWRYVWD